MKTKRMRMISLCLALALAAAFLPQMIAGAEPTPPIGDLNYDGKIHADDARIALQAAARLIEITDLIRDNGDIDGDGKVTAADARKILRAAAKLEALPARVDGPGATEQSSAEPGTTEQHEAGPGETADLKTVYGAFSTKLLKALYKNGENVLISPLSVMTALAMVENGARNGTLSQMQQMFGADAGQINEALSDYLKNLPQAEKSKFVAANSVWIREGVFDGVEESFLSAVKGYYDAEVREEPFDDKTLADVNGWCDKNTDGMIKQILDRIDPADVMYLINALTFDAEWERPFEKGEVGKKEFNNADGTKAEVEMMYGSESMLLDTDSAEGFVKPYSGGKYSFAALLPKEGYSVESLIASLDAETLTSIATLWLYGGTVMPSVRVGLPKFTSEYECELSATLRSLGMTDAFDGEKADFSGVGKLKDGNNVYISDVIHKTYISVDEQGTRAAAVTAIVAKANSIMQMRNIILDRPFVYMIVDNATSLPIFIGVMNQIGA